MQPLSHDNGLIHIPIVGKYEPITIHVDKIIQDYVYHRLRVLDEPLTSEEVFDTIKVGFDEGIPGLNLVPIVDIDVQVLADYIYRYRPEQMEEDNTPEPEIFLRNTRWNHVTVILYQNGEECHVDTRQQRYIQNAVLRSSAEIAQALPQQFSPKTVRCLRDFISYYVHRRQPEAQLEGSDLPQNQAEHWILVGSKYRQDDEHWFRHGLALHYH